MSTPLKAGSPLFGDAAAAIAAPFFQPAQPAMVAKTPASGAPQLFTVHSSNANAGEDQAIVSPNPGLRVSVSNVAIPGSMIQPSTQYPAKPSPEAPIPATDERPESHLAIANQSPKTVVEPLGLTTTGQSSSQPDAASKGISRAAPAEPSASSAVENAAVSSRSFVMDEEAVRPPDRCARRLIAPKTSEPIVPLNLN